MHGLLDDLRRGIRSSVRSPRHGLFIIAIVSLGVGCSASIFGLLNAVLLRPLPYYQPDRLFVVHFKKVGTSMQGSGLPPPVLDAWQSEAHSLQSLAGYSNAVHFDLPGAHEPERLDGALVSANFFSTLGVRPFLGRGFLPAEEKRGGDHAVVISYRLWQRRFGGTHSILRQTIQLNGRACTVAGVMPRSFDFPKGTQIWAPGPRRADEWLHANIIITSYPKVFARLAVGATVRQAEAELDVIAHPVLVTWPGWSTYYGQFSLVSLRDELFGPLEMMLPSLAGAGILVLLIACSNVSILLLARGARRRTELSVRAALGASRCRLVQQSIAETLPLFFVAGAVGLAVGAWTETLLVTLAPAGLPLAGMATFDHRVLWFTLALAASAGIVFSALPALLISGIEPATWLKEGAQQSTGGLPHRKALSLIIVFQTALALAMLIGTGLMIHSLFNILGVDMGINPNRALTMNLSLPPWKYKTSAQNEAFNEQLLADAKRLKGVKNIAIRESGLGTPVIVGPTQTDFSGPMVVIDEMPVSPEYFRALGASLAVGRAFTSADKRGSEPVAIVSRNFAQHFWPEKNAVGQRVAAGAGDDGKPQWRRVVGVANDVRLEGWDIAPNKQVYVPSPQFDDPWMPTETLYVRTDGANPLTVFPFLNSLIHSMDKDVPVTEVQTLSNLVARSMARQRFAALLLEVFAGLALFLAMAGIYSVVNLYTANNTREIGIRIALGAQPRDVLALVMRQGMSLLLYGLVCGTIAAAALTRVLGSLLYHVRPLDPYTFIGAAIVLLVMGAVASYAPARKATRVDPAVTMRDE